VKSEPSNESDADIPPGDRHGIKDHSDIASEVQRNQEENEKHSISHHSSNNDLESGNNDQVVGNRKQALTGQDTE